MFDFNWAFSLTLTPLTWPVRAQFSRRGYAVYIGDRRPDHSHYYTYVYEVCVVYIVMLLIFT